MAFLILNSEQKYKSKVSVDLLGARFGKVGSAFFNIFVVNLACGAAFLPDSSSYVPSFLFFFV